MQEPDYLTCYQAGWYCKGPCLLFAQVPCYKEKEDHKSIPKCKLIICIVVKKLQ